MASYNKVLLMGNLTRDPALKYLPNQTPVVEFGIACNRKYKLQSGEDREEVTFVDCSAFGRTAEVVNQYFQKGKPIFIEGRLKYDQWEDKQGGGKRSKLSVHIDNFQFIGGRGPGGDDDGDDYGEPAPRRQQQQPSMSKSLKDQSKANSRGEPDMSEQQFKDDDIPFASPTATGRR